MSGKFNVFELDRTGLRIDLSDDAYPTKVYSWKDEVLRDLPKGATFYGIVTEGNAHVGRSNITLAEGMFFCVPDLACIGIHSVQSMIPNRGLVIARLGYQGYRQFGGPLENRGRLRYIDGCSDTLLVCPPVVGEPCLNHLHIPPGTDQTAHTHPSQRIGVILRGSGYCLTDYTVGDPIGANQELETSGKTLKLRTELRAGMGWHIPTGLVHSFHTAPDEFLDVIAWHPDSDFGPSHDDHPMVNKTIVGGVSAAEIDEIRTTFIEDIGEVRPA